MQLEFDVAATFLGACIFVLCQLVLRFSARRDKKAKDLQEAGPEVKEAEPPDEQCADDLLEPEPVPDLEPEPAAEPEVDSAAEVPAEKSSNRKLLPFFCLALAAALLLLCAAPPLAAPPPRPGEHTSGATDSTHEVYPQVEDRGDCEPAVSVRLTRQELSSVSGDDFVHSAYYGTILVGSPALEMTVVFDTGSGNLVLPSSYCRSPACKAHRRYRRSNSHTGRDINSDGAGVAPGSPRDSLSIAYGTGEASGVFVEDRICLDNLVANDSAVSPCLTFHFIAASDLSEDPFMSFNFDGILGLGLSPLAQTKKFSFMEVMAESLRARGSRAPLTFGIFLATSQLEDSEIALGGWEKTHLREDLSWNQLYNPELGHWIVPIRGIRVDSERLDICDDGQCRAAVDTGTSLLAVPTFAFREMYEWLRHSPGAAGHCQGFGRLLHFELEAFTVTLGPRDYAEVEPVARQRLPTMFDVFRWRKLLQ